MDRALLISSTNGEDGIRQVIANEDCGTCGRPSQFEHPAGVVPGRWKCSSCGNWQPEWMKQP